MAIPSLRALLTELDHLPHAARTRRVVLLARSYAGNPKLDKLLDRLSATSDYHAHLVLTAAKAGGDVTRITAFLDHPHPRLRAAALHALPLSQLDPPEFAEHYLQAPLVTRKMLIGKAAAGHRTDLVDAVLQLPLADTDIARLLAFASVEEAAARLSDLADVIPNLARFARAHPDLLLDELADRLTGTPAAQELTWQWADPALPHLAQVRPHQLLALLTAHLHRLPVSLWHSFQPLLAADASALAVLILDPHTAPKRRRFGRQTTQLTKGLRTRLSAFSPADLGALAKRWRHDEALFTALLAALPPRERAATFALAFADDDLSTRVWSDSLLQVLPQRLRQAEAQRIAALPEQQSISAQLHWACFWRPEDAAELIESHLHTRDATERGQAWTTLLSNAANSRDIDQLEAALARLPQLANEQDPVRRAAAQALSHLNPALLGEADTGPLLVFSEAVAAAPDTSSATLTALRHTVWRMLAQAVCQAAPCDELIAIVNTLSGPDGTTDVPTDLALPRAAVPQVVAGLLPHLRARAKSRDFRLLFNLWVVLGRRAWREPELLDLVEQALNTPSDHWQRRAAQAWLDDPVTRADRVADLLEKDETFVTVAAVQRALCRQRQDLLDVCYRHTPLKGRFWGKLRFVPLLPGPFTWWLPSQLSLYADALEALIAAPRAADRARPIDALIGGPKPTAYERAQAIALLGALPGIGSQRLEPYLASDDGALVEAALAALPNSDDPGAGLETVLAHRGDDHARVAMYAAARCVRYRRPTEAAALMAEVLADPTAKVTARKEAARIIGSLHLPDALDSLSTLGEAHLDVRIAAGRALRGFLDDDRAWGGLEDVAVSGRDAELSLIETLPQQLPLRHRARYAQVLSLAAAGGDPATIARLGSWTPWSAHLSRHLAALATSPDLVTSQAGCFAVGIAASLAPDWAPYEAAVARLAAAAGSDEEPNAEVRLDLPSWQRLGDLLTALTPQKASDLAYHRDHLLGLAKIIDPYPELADFAWRLRVEATDWSQPSEALLDLADRVDPLRACEVGAHLDSTLRRLADQGTEPRLDQVVELLAAPGEATAGVFAVILTVFAGERSGWTSSWRGLLRALRAHPVSAVAALAHQHFTATC